MDSRTEELIAIGASVTANCIACLRHHVSQAKKAGADEDQIERAVKIGRMVRKDAAASWDEEGEAFLCLESSIEEGKDYKEDDQTRSHS